MKKKTNRKIIGMAIFALLFVMTSLVIVSAEFWACKEYREVVNYCDNYKPSRTCLQTMGCSYCMSVYDEVKDCFVHGSWPVCQNLDPECGTYGTGTIDTEPPVLIINSPIEGEIYKSRSVLLDFSTDTKADVSYFDLINGRGRTTGVCRNCFSYSRSRSFKEGYNHIRFEAKDMLGNPVYEEVTFFVDSKKPRISRVEPRRGFASGEFEIQFQEDNPFELIIHYGNHLGYKDHEVNITSECVLDRTRYKCNTNIDLKEYDGTNIFYTVKLKDIADNTVESRRPTELTVDMTFPVILNPTTLFEQGEGRYSRYVTFNVDVTEQNLEKVYYTYKDYRGNDRDKTLCTRLKDNVCEKRLSFREGHYDITLKVIDEAGNFIGEPLSFDVEY